MIYWLRIIFLSILSLLVFQSMEENVISAYMTDTCAENILSDTDKDMPNCLYLPVYSLQVVKIIMTVNSHRF